MLRATLILYILKAMLSWVPLANFSPVAPEHTMARYTVIAEAIADVTLDPAESAVFPRQVRAMNLPPLTPDEMRTEDILGNALALASTGAFEGGYLEYVDDGSCNDPSWRLKHPDIIRHGDCDGGHAWTIWQIHTMGGLVLTGPYVTGYMYVEGARQHPETIVTGPKMIADHRLASRTALHILRVSMRDHHSLCAYTGEACDGTMPLAKNRLNRPLQYRVSHPWAAFESSLLLTQP